MQYVQYVQYVQLCTICYYEKFSKVAEVGANAIFFRRQQLLCLLSLRNICQILLEFPEDETTNVDEQNYEDRIQKYASPCGHICNHMDGYPHEPQEADFRRIGEDRG